MPGVYAPKKQLLAHFLRSPNEATKSLRTAESPSRRSTGWHDPWTPPDWKRRDKIMTTPIPITFRHLPASQAVASLVQEELAKLQHRFERIIGCEVTIEGIESRPIPEHFAVRIELMIPGERILVDHDSSRQKPGE